MLTRWDDIDRTFAMMDELRRRMDHFFGGSYESGGYAAGPYSAATWPRLNLFDTGSAVVVKAEVPGVSEKEIQLTINQDVITLSGERKADAPEGYSVHRQERTPIKFSRSVTLPCKVDPDQTSASLKDGVLSITLQKAAEARPKQITVSAS